MNNKHFNFHAVAKSHRGADEQYEINFRWPKVRNQGVIDNIRTLTEIQYSNRLKIYSDHSSE